MALPIVVIAVKVLSIKFLKGAVFGFARYVHRLFRKEHKDNAGNPLEGKQKLDHIVSNELSAKDNLIYLILMLSNVFFGAQEMFIWIWIFCAKRLFPEFRTGLPSALEDPEMFAQRLRRSSWSIIWREIGRWLSIASLVYWPSMPGKQIAIRKNKDDRWLELLYGRHTYLLRIDEVRTILIADLIIVVNNDASIEVKVKGNEEVLQPEFIS